MKVETDRSNLHLKVTLSRDELIRLCIYPYVTFTKNDPNGWQVEVCSEVPMPSRDTALSDRVSSMLQSTLCPVRK